MTILISIFRSVSPADPSAHPAAVKRGQAPLTERIARTSSTDPNAVVEQPRLEGVKEYDPDTALHGDIDGKVRGGGVLA